MDNVPTNEENVVARTEEEEINELASMLASVGIDEEDEAVLDMLYAEHEARMNAANSYDNDASSYGEMI
jgi:hypothetical protein